MTATAIASSPTPSAATYEPLLQTPDVDAGRTDDEDAANEHTSVGPSQSNTQIWWIHFIFGCAVLLPWNVMITATPYFLSRLSGSSFKTAFSSYLSITFTIANFCFLAHATLTSHHSSPSRRIFVSTTVLAILVGLLALSTTVHLPPSVFFSFVLLNGILQACAGSYLQTAVVADASLFGPVALQACMAGQAFVGVVLSAVQLLSTIASVRTSTTPRITNIDLKADEGTAEARAAVLFFGLSTLFLCFTIGVQMWHVRLPQYKVIMRPLEQVKRGDDGTYAGILQDKARILRVLKANVQYEIAVAYVFTVTLAVFPPITATVQPADPTAFHPFIFTATHFLLFNVGDLAGRYLCAVPKLLTWSSWRLLTLSLSRTLFIPLFLLCNIQRPSSSLPIPGIPADPSPTSADPVVAPSLRSDALFFLLLLLFGLSNGYISSMGMIAAPNVAHNTRLQGRRDDVDIAAILASFCLVGGLAIGAAASFIVRAQVCGCNPFIE